MALASRLGGHVLGPVQARFVPVNQISTYAVAVEAVVNDEQEIFPQSVVAVQDQEAVGLVALNGAICIVLHLEHSSRANSLCSRRQVDNFPCPIGQESEDLLVCSLNPLLCIWARHCLLGCPGVSTSSKTSKVHLLEAVELVFTVRVRKVLRWLSRRPEWSRWCRGVGQEAVEASGGEESDLGQGAVQEHAQQQQEVLEAQEAQELQEAQQVVQ